MIARRVDIPSPGFYRFRRVKGGPWVAAEITFGPAVDPVTGETLDRSPRFDVRVSGAAVTGPEAKWMLDRVHHWGQPITESEHALLCATRDWALKHAPHMPEATPEKTVVVTEIPRLFHPRGQAL